jgi:hypothetical protein
MTHFLHCCSDEVENSEVKASKSMASKVWKFYEVVPGEERVRCLLCSATLSHKYHSTKGSLSFFAY